MAALCALPSLADARTRMPAISPECNVTMPCIGVGVGGKAQTRNRQESTSRFTSPSTSPFVKNDPTFARPELSSAGLVGPLQSKLASIESACPGTQAISTVRHTRIAGTRVMSLHAQGKAVDVRGPYGCIYGQLIVQFVARKIRRQRRFASVAQFHDPSVRFQPQPLHVPPSASV